MIDGIDIGTTDVNAVVRFGILKAVPQRDRTPRPQHQRPRQGEPPFDPDYIDLEDARCRADELANLRARYLAELPCLRHRAQALRVAKARAVHQAFELLDALPRRRPGPARKWRAAAADREAALAEQARRTAMDLRREAASCHQAALRDVQDCQRAIEVLPALRREVLAEGAILAARANSRTSLLVPG